MKNWKFLLSFVALVVILVASMAARESYMAAKRMTAPYLKTVAAEAQTNSETTYHTLWAVGSTVDEAFLSDLYSISVQIELDSVSGDGTTLMSLQASNEIAATPTWVDIWTNGAGWTIDEDTIIVLTTPNYAQYRTKYVHTGTGVDNITTHFYARRSPDK